MIHPRFWGVGFAILMIVTFTLMHYAILFPWSLSFFVDSFISPFPWAANIEDRETGEFVWNANYFHDEVLQRSESINEPFRLVPRMVILLLVSYVIIYFTVQKGL
mmetsp:Transcript_31107/g.47521  ORF Transcript_31107/g.47521 Transcript_31107/m.47521 type:complete len:105 (-) Transcript_31107:1220-1534(-)